MLENQATLNKKINKNKYLNSLDVRRRSLVNGAAAWSVLAWSSAVRAQQAGRMYRIGFLMGIAEDDDGKARVGAFRQALEKLGRVEGRTVNIDLRWGGGDANRVHSLAKELIAAAPDLLVAGGITAAVVLARQTRSIPIVFAHASDPVGSGIVQSLARPGGNVTGFTTPEQTVPGKFLEILKEMAPRTAHVGIVFGGDTVPGGRAQFLKMLGSDAAALRLRASLVPLHDVATIDSAIAAAARSEHTGLVVLQDIFTTVQQREIIEAAARHRLPAIYAAPAFASGGGMVAYGANPVGAYQGAAGYVERILKGEKPESLPVQQPTHYELVANLRTAKALGITIPPSVMVRATKVIE